MASSAIPPTSTIAELPWINVMDYGAVADNSTDNTDAFNNALTAAVGGQTVFVPSGVYVVNGDITVPAFKFLAGGGNFGTTVRVTTDTQSQGLFNLSMASALRNLVITYEQPDDGAYIASTVPPVHSALIHYKPAIYIDSTPWGATVESVRIIRAWDGITSVNGGRSYLKNIEISMFNRAIDWDGALDTVRVENFHVWPFSLTSDQNDAFHLPGHSVALYLGRVDGFHISNLMAINGGGIDAHIGPGGTTGASGPPNVYCTSCVFDSNPAIQFSAGSGLFTNCAFTSAQPAAQLSFVVLDAKIMISNSHFFGGATGGWLQLNGGNTQISNCRFTSVKWKDFLATVLNDTPSIVSTAGDLQVTGSYFDRPVNTSFTTPIIKLTGGDAIITSNMVTNKGSGTGDFIKNTTSGVTIIDNNIYTGWTIS